MHDVPSKATKPSPQESLSRVAESFFQLTGMGLGLVIHGPQRNSQVGWTHPCESCQARSLSCLAFQDSLAKRCQDQPLSEECHLGKYESAIPVFAGKERVATLFTGRVSVNCQADAYDGIAISKERYEAAVEMARLVALYLGRVFEAAGSNVDKEREEELPHPIATRACRYIDTHLHEPLTHGHIAKALHVSAGHLSRVFKTAVGIPASQYISTRRYQTAKRLLARKSLRVSDVAFEVGFQSLSQFNRTFRQFAGMSPTQYRHRLGMKE